MGRVSFTKLPAFELEKKKKASKQITQAVYTWLISAIVMEKAF